MRVERIEGVSSVTDDFLVQFFNWADHLLEAFGPQASPRFCNSGLLGLGAWRWSMAGSLFFDVFASFASMRGLHCD